MRKLNEKYASDGLYEALNSAVYIPSIDELDEKNVLECKKHALDDFNYPIEHVERELSIFSFEEILAYLERSAYRALDVCRPYCSKTGYTDHLKHKPAAASCYRFCPEYLNGLGKECIIILRVVPPISIRSNSGHSSPPFLDRARTKQELSRQVFD